MKIAVIVTAAVLATGSAFAADYGTHSDRDTSRHAAVAQHNDNGATHESFLDRTKRALHRMGDKMRKAGHRLARSSHTNQTASGNRDETRSMGAAGEQKSDGSRQHRMDQAYNDWQHKQNAGDKR